MGSSRWCSRFNSHKKICCSGACKYFRDDDNKKTLFNSMKAKWTKFSSSIQGINWREYSSERILSEKGSQQFAGSEASYIWWLWIIWIMPRPGCCSFPPCHWNQCQHCCRLADSCITSRKKISSETSGRKRSISRPSQTKSPIDQAGAACEGATKKLPMGALPWHVLYFSPPKQRKPRKG